MPVDDGRYSDPILELARRRGGGDVSDFISLASEMAAGVMTPAEAEIELSNLDWAEAKERAAGMLADFRRQGLV
jgi:hypothetical protein